MSRTVFVTGASGFLGRALLNSTPQSFQFLASSRRDLPQAGVNWLRSPNLSAQSDWKPLLEGVDSIVHLAGRVHLPSNKDLDFYRSENFEGTLKLANDAVSSGVRRFIFLSTAKVVGDESASVALNEDAPPLPGDAYAASKLLAEQALAKMGGSLDVTILRPPLVYGPGVRANFLSLISAVDRGVPLPLGGISNRRSLVGVDNLASAIVTCLNSSKAGGRIFHVTDGNPFSTPGLARAIAGALGRPARIFGVPPSLLEFAGALVGRKETIKRLTRSLELDDRAIRETLGWLPKKGFEQGLAETIAWYREKRPR